jgi:endonuclease G
MNLEKLIHETAERFQQRATIRTQAEASIARGDIASANNAHRYTERIRRLGADLALTVASISGAESLLGALSKTLEFRKESFGQTVAPRGAAPPIDPPRIGLERVLGKNDLIGVTFLIRGAQVAAAVGCVADRNQRGFGSGFRVANRLFLTNNHVLPSEAEAAATQVRFNFQVGLDGRLEAPQIVDLDPATFFITDEELDYTLVALLPTSIDGRALEPHNFVRLDPRQGKILVGESVNIIQHPNGEPKQVALRENRVVDILDDDHFIHYETDTAPGSSGGAVFNDQWEVVALHHSGVPSRDRSGNILTPDGTIWQSSMGEHRVHWIANEGVRASRILAHLQASKLDAAKASILREVFDARESAGAAVLPLPSSTPAPTAPVPANTDASPASSPEVPSSQPSQPRPGSAPSRTGSWT